MKPSSSPFRRLALAAPLALAFAGLTGGCNLLFGIEGGQVDAAGGLGGGGVGAAGGGTAGTGGTGGTTGGGGTVASTGGGGTGGTTATGGAGGMGGAGGTTATGGAGGTGGTGGTGGAGGGPITDGLALLLHMDEADWTAGDSVVDASGNGNHGTVSGTAVPTADGKIGGAGLFDGSGWIVVPDADSLHPTDELTCAVWVFPTGLADGVTMLPSPGIVSKREAFGANVAFTMFVYELNNAYVDIQADRFHSDAALSNGEWYHLAFVYDGKAESALRTRIYVNGVLDSVHASDSSFSPNTQDVQVGGLPGGGEPFIGKLDELALWTRALTPAEIQSVYETGVVP